MCEFFMAGATPLKENEECRKCMCDWCLWFVTLFCIMFLYGIVYILVT
jgi:hypothetical protein